MSRGVELVTWDVKSCRGIRSSPLDTCPTPLIPRVSTLPVFNVGDTFNAEMKSYGLIAWAPWTITHLSAPIAATFGTSGWDRGTNVVATANFQIALPDMDPPNPPKWAEWFSEFLLLIGQQHAELKTKWALIKNLCKKKVTQRQMKTAISKSSTWSDCLK